MLELRSLKFKNLQLFPPKANDKKHVQVSAWIFVEKFPQNHLGGWSVRMVMGCCSEKNFHRLWSSCWRSTNGSAVPWVGSWELRESVGVFFCWYTFYRVILGRELGASRFFLVEYWGIIEVQGSTHSGWIKLWGIFIMHCLGLCHISWPEIYHQGTDLLTGKWKRDDGQTLQNGRMGWNLLLVFLFGVHVWC